MPNARLVIPAAAMLFAAAALAGCKSQGPERAMARFHGDPAMRAQAITTPSGAPGEALPPAGSKDDAPAAQTAARPDPEAPLPEVDARPERFRGLGQSAVASELGRPALIRAEGPARVLQYRGRACVLDLVLYPGPDGPAVRHLEARDPVDAAPRDTASCLKDLLQRDAAATG